MRNEYMKIDRVIITGADGFIGSALTKRLIANDAEVWAVVRNPTSMDELNKFDRLHVITAPFEDYGRLQEQIQDRYFDAFVHLAWAGYGSATNDPNVQINNILQSGLAAVSAIRLKVRRFLFADSLHEHLLSNDARGNPGRSSIYGTAKYCAQQMCRTITHTGGVEYVGLMFSNVFGEGDKSSRSVNTFIRKLQAGEDLNLVDGSKLYGWIYIDDCISAILAAATSGTAGKVYYIGGIPQKLENFVTVMRDIINPESKLNFAEYPDDSYIDFGDIDVSALNRDTGFLPQADLRESIDKTSKWIESLDR